MVEDLTSEERDAALRVANEMVEANSRGELWAGIQSLRWSVDDFVALAKASARYCPSGIPYQVPAAFATENDLTVKASLPEAPVPVPLGSARMRIDLPPGGVLGIIDDESSDGVPQAPFDADGAQTGLLIDHTQPIAMPNGEVVVMKRQVGFPIDSAGGHGRSGEM